MGYTFTIGNAVPRHDKSDFPHLWAEWKVQKASHPEAPTFPNDAMTSNGNARSPSYGVWSEFCREVGLYDFFYDSRGNLHAGHPGCIGLTKEDADAISAALTRYRAKAKLPPGFEGWGYKGPDRYDAWLARLIWLDWWTRWAVENCETPAIQNT
jgi:hypothetical protein